MKSRSCIVGALAAGATIVTTGTTGSTRATDASKNGVSTFPLEPVYPVLRVIEPPNMAPVDLANEWKITDLVNSTVEFLRTSTTDVAGPFSTKTQDDVKGAGEQTMRIDDFSGLWFSIPTATTSTHDLTITMRPYSIRTTYNDLRDGTGDSSTPVILTNTKRILGTDAQPEIPPSLVVHDHGTPNSPPVVEPALVKLLSITKGFMLVCFEFCVGLALAKMWQWKAADFMNVDFDKAGAPAKRYSGLGRPEMEALQEGLNIYGRGLVNVIGDGNCLFRSVSYGIFGNEGRYHFIRACAVRNLCEFPDMFMPFVGDHCTYISHVQQMSKNTTWGTEVEIAALCKGLGLSIRVWRANPHTGEVDNYPHKIEGEETDERDAIDIAFLNDMKHYFAVVPLG